MWRLCGVIFLLHQALCWSSHTNCKKTNCEDPKGGGKGRCSCRHHNIPCTDLCKCIDCKNSVPTENDMDDIEDSDNAEDE
uniref:protein lin-54 homolog n=1 Tax=Myxine glutinosa TaxID=7769 RepID=UPI00358E7F98